MELLLRVEEEGLAAMDTPSPPRGFDAMDLCGTELGVPKRWFDVSERSCEPVGPAHPVHPLPLPVAVAVGEELIALEPPPAKVTSGLFRATVSLSLG